MSYTPLLEVHEIEALYQGQKYGETTKPTRADVEMWIAEATAEIFNALSVRYTLPITNENDLLSLKILCKMYVLEHVNYTTLNNKIVYNENGTSYPLTLNLKKFYDTLNMYKTGEYILSNTAANEDSLAFNSYNSDNGVEAIAQKETVQW